MNNRVQAQLIESLPLDEKLNEISGLELIGDSLLVGFNDGGNKPKLYVMTLKGKIIHKVTLADVKNKDWEDITSDGEYLYIGDIGNNENKRTGLKVYKVKITDVLEKEEIKAKTIRFNYGEQKAYPPPSDKWFYDAEGMTYYNDSLWIFTKDRSSPSDGNALVYKIPIIPGEYTVYQSHKVFIGTRGWWKDGITAVDVYGDDFYILTYNRYMIKTFKNGSFIDKFEFEFNRLTQRESIVVLNKASIFVADEKNPLAGDVKLYRIQPERD